MKYTHTGIPDPTVLDNPVEINPHDFALLSPLGRLDFLLGMIAKKNPTILTKYVQNLTSKYENSLERSEVDRREINIETLILEKENLRAYPMLAKANLNFFLQQLNLPDDVDWSETQEVPERQQLRSLLMPKYYNVLTLTETIQREEAIDLYKEYTQSFMENYLGSPDEKYESLEEWAKDALNTDLNGKGYFRIWGEVEDGRVVIRKDSCPWDDAVEDIADRELKYYVCCYGDFFSIKSESPHFALTMEYTIAKGDPYCDVVIHDTRINNKLEHPSKEFFDNLNPD